MLQIKEQRCTVCDKEDSTIRSYGGRDYCETHIHLFYEDSRELWQACILTFGSIIVTIISSAIFSILAPSDLSGTSLPVAGMIASVIPGVVWIVSLYRYGRLWNGAISPLVPIVSVTGILSAAAISHPFSNNLIGLGLWLTKTTALNRLLGDILLGGLFHTYVIFMIVRIAGWTHATFYNRVTGITLTLAVTVGYSTMLCLMYVFDSGGLLVLSGNLRLVSMLCSLIAPGLVLGYFVGISRFEDLPFTQLTIGFGSAAALNGLLTYISTETGYVGLSLTQNGFSPWPGAVICMVITIGTFIAVYGLIQRQNHIAQARIEPSQ